MTLYIQYKIYLFFNLSFQNILKDYIPIFVLSLIGYIFHFYIKSDFSIEDILLKILVFIVLLFFIFKFYGQKIILKRFNIVTKNK